MKRKRNLFFIVAGLFIIFALFFVVVRDNNFNVESRAAGNSIIGDVSKFFGFGGDVLSSSENEFMRANNLIKLGNGDIGVVKKELGKESGELISKDIIFENGAKITLDADKTTSFTVIEGDSSGSLYIENDPTLAIYSQDPSSNEKIEAAIKDKLKEKETVPVIIQFDIVEKFYEKNQRKEKTEEKGRNFDRVKNDVAYLMSSKSKIKRDLKIINGVSADIDLATLEKLEKNSVVKKVEYDKEVSVVLDESPGEINASIAWNLIDPNGFSLTGIGRTIAVIDTGVDYTHPDLGGCIGPDCKVIGGYDFVNGDVDPMDDMGHGTHVAATAAGKGLLLGIAPDAKIYAYKVCTGSGACKSTDIIAAIERSVDPNQDGDTSDHADVSTLSLGGPGTPDDSMSQAADNGVDAGVVLTIAAGNSGGISTIGSPGTARKAITVAAACAPHSDLIPSLCGSPIATFSSKGPLIWMGEDIQKPDIAAPGVSICAARWDNAFDGKPTCFDDNHIRISGTSMATPHVAGVAALLVQAYPEHTPLEIKQLIKSTARDLGMPYDYQGAGMIDVIAAIPVAPQVSYSPFSWYVTTDSSIKISSTSGGFNVTRLNSSLTNVDILVDTSGASGITYNLSKNQLVFSSGSDSFTATLNIDNDLIEPKSYALRILLSSGGELIGSIPIFLTVPSSLVSIPAKIDYGVDDPRLSSWTSSVQIVGIQNLRTDITQTVNIVGNFSQPGITFQSNTSSLIIPPNSTRYFQTTITLDNTVLTNKVYTGTIDLHSAGKIRKVDAEVTKFFVLTIRELNPADPHTYLVVHNTTTGILALSFVNEKKIYLNSLGNYDIIVKYEEIPEEGNDTTYFISYKVFKEQVAITNVTNLVEVSRAEAVNEYSLRPRDKQNQLLPVGSLSTSDKYIPKKSMLSILTFLMGVGDITLGVDYVSNVSPDYEVRKYFDYPSHGGGSEIYGFYSELGNGINSDEITENSPGDFKVINIRGFQENPFGIANSVIYTFHEPFGSSTNIRYQGISKPVNQTIYSLWPNSDYHQNEITHAGCVDGIPCAGHFWSPRFNSSIPIIRELGLMLPDASNNTIYQGLGPSVWSGEFVNSPTRILVYPHFGYSALIRQDYSLTEYWPLNYRVKSGGVEIANGAVPIYLMQGFDATRILLDQNVSPGKYEAMIDIPYEMSGKNYSGNFTANFDTSVSDPNPPSINRMFFYSNGERSEYYRPGKNHLVEMEFDPIGGSISQVLVSYSLNGTAYIPLTVSNSGGVYSSTIPNITGVNKTSIKISAVDSSSNNMTYIFELPVGVPETNYGKLDVSVSSVGWITGEGGINCGRSGGYCSASYQLNTTVNLTANPGISYNFDSWLGACAGQGANCTLFIDGDKQTTAVFSRQNLGLLHLGKRGTGYGTLYTDLGSCGPECNTVDVFKEYGKLINISATSEPGSIFISLTGCAANQSSCVINTSSYSYLYAKFDWVNATPSLFLDVDKVGTGQGLVISADGGINCGSDCDHNYVKPSKVNLTSIPLVGSVFSGYIGLCSVGGTNPNCTVDLNAVDKAIVANFSLASLTSCGDANTDGKIDIIDLALDIYWQGKNFGDSDWASYRVFDINGDLKVDYLDVQGMINKLGQSC